MDISGYDAPLITEKLIMNNNEGGWDRGVRVVLGFGLLSLTTIGPHSWLGLFGLVPLVTGLWGFCPLYRAFGFDTRQVTRKQ